MICPGCYRNPCSCAQPATVRELIAETGDHPTSGVFCPGRHRAPWTAELVLADAHALVSRLPGGPVGRHVSGEVRPTRLGDMWIRNALVMALLEPEFTRVSGVLSGTDSVAALAVCSRA